MFYIDDKFSTKKINKALKENRQITFKSGNYRLTDCLILHSNTTVNCESGVRFERAHKGRMLQAYVTPDTTKYNGAHDIRWSGGTFVADTNSANANVITLFHAKNINFDGVSVKGCRGLHSLELNACRRVTIENCTFMGQSAKPDGGFREAIQIDFANLDGLAIPNADGKSPCYDGTHCKDIYIYSCSFYDVPNGIGTHTVSVAEDYHTNIVIDGCKFQNVTRNLIQVLGMKDVTITSSEVYMSSDSDEGNKEIIAVKTTATAHKNSGGKVKLSADRYNKNVTVKDSPLLPARIFTVFE